MNKFLQFLLLIFVVSCVSGCSRAYVGCRTYDETTTPELVNSFVYEKVYFFSEDENTLSLMEKKKVKNTYSKKHYKVDEYIYHENNVLFSLVIKTMVSPIMIAFFPVVLTTNSASEVSYNGNVYIYSKGRKIWNIYNPFGGIYNGLQIAGVEEEKVLRNIEYEYKTTESSELLKNFKLSVRDGENNLSVENGISMSELRQRVFRYAFPERNATIAVTGKNVEKTIELNSAQIADDDSAAFWRKLLAASDEKCFYEEKHFLEKVEHFRDQNLLSPAGYAQIRKDICQKSARGRKILFPYEKEIEKIRFAK